jgi:hypothetical protein
MHGLDSFEDDNGTAFRDVITLALAGFVVCVILILPHLNPPGAKTAQAMDPPGNVILEIRWPDELDTDVDLWVQGPNDAPVGYSNKGGKLFNLLRDDLGKRGDSSGLNYEVSYSRGVIAGEYVVNVHLYRNPSSVAAPIPVTVVTSVKKSEQESARQILVSNVELAREGQELTVYRFSLTKEGELVPGSVDSLQKSLRSWKKAS